jgi:hypothetical protein
MAGRRSQRAGTGAKSGQGAWGECLASPLSLRMSTLLTRKTTFLPHCRIYFKKRTSLSVNGRSAWDAQLQRIKKELNLTQCHIVTGMVFCGLEVGLWGAALALLYPELFLA